MNKYLWALQSYKVEHSGNKIILTTGRDPKDLTDLPFVAGNFGDITLFESQEEADAAAARATILETNAVTRIVELQYKERTFFAVKKDGEYLNTKNAGVSAWESREEAQEFADDTNETVECDLSLETTHEWWWDVVRLEIKPVTAGDEAEAAVATSK